MKRREKPRVGLGGIPLEFAVGRAFEVWADPATTSSYPSSVMSRYSKAWEEFLHRKGSNRAEGSRLRPDLGMYSVEFLIAEGRRDEVERRLAQAGAVVSDLPDLRARAVEWVAAYQRRVGTRRASRRR